MHKAGYGLGQTLDFGINAARIPALLI